jgi:hypothetical protein
MKTKDIEHKNKGERYYVPKGLELIFLQSKEFVAQVSPGEGGLHSQHNFTPGIDPIDEENLLMVYNYIASHFFNFLFKSKR